MKTLNLKTQKSIQFIHFYFLFESLCFRSWFVCCVWSEFFGFNKSSKGDPLWSLFNEVRFMSFCLDYRLCNLLSCFGRLFDGFLKGIVGNWKCEETFGRPIKLKKNTLVHEFESRMYSETTLSVCFFF